MLRFNFFTAKQGTWVHKDDRGPFLNKVSWVHVHVNWTIRPVEDLKTQLFSNAKIILEFRSILVSL